MPAGPEAAERGGRRFLLVHGWQHRRPPEHWLRWLSDELRGQGEEVAYPQLPAPDAPDLADWLSVLRGWLAEPDDRERVVVCHSLGCLLWLHHACSPPSTCQALATPSQGERLTSRDLRADRLLLVAPPSPTLVERPELTSFAPAVFDARAVAESSRSPVRLVCSDNDPYCPEGAVTAYGGPLGLDVDLLPGTAHLNPDSGLGPWPDALAWCLDGEHRFGR